MTVDLKTEQPLKNQDGILIDLLPSREDSYDRLLAVDKQFAAENTTADEVCARHEWIAELHRCLALLKDDERALIQALYFDGQTECEYADQIGRKQQSVNERRQRILAKLKKLMKF